MKYIAAVDLGTTCVKAFLYDETSRMVGRAESEQTLSTPGPGMAEQDPGAWYETVCALIRKTLAEAGVNGRDVTGVGITSQGISFVPTDIDFRPLGMGISWLDDRAREQCLRAEKEVGREEFWARTGRMASSLCTLPKLMWFRENEPELFNKAAYFLLPMDYLAARMTGNAVTDTTMAGATMMASLSTGEWDSELCALAGVETRRLARILPSGSIAGRVNAETAILSGLSEDTLVVLGAQDQKSAARGAFIDENSATFSMGTAGVFTSLIKYEGKIPPMPGEGFSFSLSRFSDGYLALEGCIDTFGAALRWARDVFAPVGGYDELNANAEGASAGGARFAASLATGGGFSGVTLATGRRELIRAVYDGLAREAGAYAREAKRLGARVERVSAFGGGARSRPLIKALAEEMGAPLKARDDPETAAYGAMLCARAASQIGS